VRDGRFGANGYNANVVYQHFFAHSAPVSNNKVPRKINARRRIEMDVPAYPGSKAAENETAPGETRARAEAEKPLPGRPQNPARHFRARIVRCPPIRTDIESVVQTEICFRAITIIDFASGGILPAR
jgi:hypothetical protein